MKLYRYEDRVYSTVSFDVSGCERYGTTPVKVELYEYNVTKETRCGYWIDYAFTPRWVSKRPSAFAKPTMEQALQSFKFRKLRQIKILEKQLRRANEALRLVS